MISKKAQINIKFIIISVIALIIILAFIPIFANIIVDVQDPITATAITDDNATYFGISFALNNSPIVASSVIAFNRTAITQVFNQTGETGDTLVVVLFPANATVNMTEMVGDGTTTLGFNYTANIRQSAGLSASSVILLGFVLLVVVAFIIIFAIKRFYK